MTAPKDELGQLAGLLHKRNELDSAIARLIGRPAASGHLGEFIAARVFDIELEASAAARAIDGRFNGGALAGRSVNVKCYSVQQAYSTSSRKAAPTTTWCSPDRVKRPGRPAER